MVVQRDIDKLFSRHATDDRYYTKEQADERYVNADGDTMTGLLVGTDVALSGQIQADIVGEKTGAHGVIIDGLTVKDGGVTLATGADLLAAGASCDIGSTSQMFDNVYAAKYGVSTAGTEYAYSSGAGIFSIAAATKIALADDLYVDVANSYVGIGTSAPARILHVKASSAGISSWDATAVIVLERTVAPRLFFAANATGSGGGIAWCGPADTFITAIDYYHDTSALRIYTNNAEVANFYSTGLAMNAGKDILAAGASSDIGSTSQMFDNIYGTKYHVTIAGTEYVYSQGPADATLRAGGAVSLNVNGVDVLRCLGPSCTINGGKGDVDFIACGDTDASLLWVDAGNDRVGIGTCIPTEKLDVNGNIKLSGVLYTDDILEHTGNAGVTIDGVKCKDGKVVVSTGGSIGLNGGGNITFTDGESLDKVEVLAAQLSVALGLEVAGGKDILAAGASSNIGSTGQMFDNVYATKFLVTTAGTEYMYSASAGNFTIAAATQIALADDLYVDVTNGYVGIGTSAPARALHVKASAAGISSWDATAVMIIERTLKPRLFFAADGTGEGGGIGWCDPADVLITAIDYMHNTSVLRFYVNNTTVADFYSAGLKMMAGKHIETYGASSNIGSTSHMFANVYATKHHVTAAGTEYVYSQGAANATLRAGGDVNLNVNGIDVLRCIGTCCTINGGKDDVNFQACGNEDDALLWVDAGMDHVGIGTPIPGEKLDVAGNINTTGVLKVAGTQVVGAQGDAVKDAEDAVTAITQLNLLLARCRAHGLIAT